MKKNVYFMTGQWNKSHVPHPVLNFLIFLFSLVNWSLTFSGEYLCALKCFSWNVIFKLNYDGSSDFTKGLCTDKNKWARSGELKDCSNIPARDFTYLSLQFQPCLIRNIWIQLRHDVTFCTRNDFRKMNHRTERRKQRADLLLKRGGRYTVKNFCIW